MSDDFDELLARNMYNLVSEMDDDEAEGFVAVWADEVHKSLVDANQRLITKDNAEYALYVQETAEAICKSLEDEGRFEEAEAVRIGAYYGLEHARSEISKADKPKVERVKPVRPVNPGSKGYNENRSKDGKFASVNTWVRGQADANRRRAMANHSEMKSTSNSEQKMWKEVADDYPKAGREAVSAFQRHEQQENSFPRENTSMDRTWNTMQSAGSLAGGLGAAGMTAGIPGAATVAAAGNAANLAGQMAPHGERIVGPAVRRAKYRYSGTERSLDKKLVGDANKMTKLFLEHSLQDMPENRRRQVLSEISRNPASISRFIDGDTREAAAIRASVNYLKDQIPDARLNNLRLGSGKVAPSQGVIITADGKIAHQSVGNAEDHYLPFSHRNLKALKGGTYVRTRTMGGPTAEDIRTGLQTGLKTMVVASHSGVFQVDFDDEFDGKQRSSARAKQMVDRYEKLLDAVQSRQVTKTPLNREELMDIDDAVEAELRMHGLQDDANERKVLTERRRKEAMERPRLTREEMNQAKELARRDYPRNESEWTPDERKAIQRAERQIQGRMLEEKGERFYQLNAKGYQDALKALQDEFPYFIQVQDLIQEGDVFGNLGMDSTDSGYVKPRFLHPEAEQHGYFGEGINAPRGQSGKVSGDRTDYQNWRYNNTGPGSTRAQAAESTQRGQETQGQPQGQSKIQRAQEEQREVQKVPRHLVDGISRTFDALFEDAEDATGEPNAVRDIQAASKELKRFAHMSAAEKARALDNEESARKLLVAARRTSKGLNNNDVARMLSKEFRPDFRFGEVDDNPSILPHEITGDIEDHLTAQVPNFKERVTTLLGTGKSSQELKNDSRLLRTQIKAGQVDRKEGAQTLAVIETARSRKYRNFDDNPGQQPTMDTTSSSTPTLGPRPSGVPQGTGLGAGANMGYDSRATEGRNYDGEFNSMMQRNYQS